MLTSSLRLGLIETAEVLKLERSLLRSKEVIEFRFTLMFLVLIMKIC